jgi:hypothetical protein
MNLRLVLLLSLTVAAGTSPPAAEPSIQPVYVCPAGMSDTRPPDFQTLKCRVLPLSEVDPQQSHIWLGQTVQLTESQRDQFVGLLVSAKASSLVYLNGELLGSNGRLGDNAEQEMAGQMDTVMPIPRGLVKTGANQLALRMSSQHGFVRSTMILRAELKRRNVIRMAGLYLVGAWLIVQVAATLLPVFSSPAAGATVWTQNANFDGRGPRMLFCESGTGFERSRD